MRPALADRIRAPGLPSGGQCGHFVPILCELYAKSAGNPQSAPTAKNRGPVAMLAALKVITEHGHALDGARCERTGQVVHSEPADLKTFLIAHERLRVAARA